MKKTSINRVSTRLIKRILQRDIAARAKTMSDAINGDTTTFSGTQPFDAVAIAAIILTFTSAQSAYKVGGTMKRMAFNKAKKAIYDCILSFSPYVNKLANGNQLILDLSTLPTLFDELDFAALIAAGAVAVNVKVKQGKFAREIDTDSDSFGLGVGYFVALSEGGELPVDFTINASGQVNCPGSNRIFINFAKDRKKTFTGLLPKTEYFVYYVLTYGTTIGILSNGISIVTSA